MMIDPFSHCCKVVVRVYLLRRKSSSIPKVSICAFPRLPEISDSTFPETLKIIFPVVAPDDFGLQEELLSWRNSLPMVAHCGELYL